MQRLAKIREFTLILSRFYWTLAGASKILQILTDNKVIDRKYS